MVFGCRPLSLRCFRCVWYCWSKCVLVDDEFMLACPHERLQNHTFIDEGVFVKINSCGQDLLILRVAASSNTSVKFAPAFSLTGRAASFSQRYRAIA